MGSAIAKARVHAIFLHPGTLHFCRSSFISKERPVHKQYHCTMKCILLLLLLACSTGLFGQSVISSVNAGAQSSNSMIFSVGEIFVLPENDGDEASSGLMGVVAHVAFFVTGVNDRLSTDDVRAYPNPTSQTLFFETQNTALTHVSIFDAHGREVVVKQLSGNQVDMSELPNGVYFVRTNMEHIAPFRIIKQ